MAAARDDVAIRVTLLAMYSVAVAGLGVLLVSAAFVPIWASIPRWVPWRPLLACAAGVLMVASSVGLWWRRTVVLSSSILTFEFLIWLLLLHAPHVIRAPSEELLWSGAAQLVTIVAGGWIVFASCATEGRGRWLRSPSGVRIARSLYAAALPMLGLHHFLTNGAAEAVPAWLPFRTGWVYMTGAAHIAAGAAILFGIVPRLAATLEAIMITGFVLLVHLPGVIGTPGDPLQWTMFFAAAAIGGAAWIVAHSRTSW